MKEFNSQSGKSLLEIVVVLAITAILVTAAVARLGNSKTYFQRQNLARELKISLERARFDSVKRRPSITSDMSRVIINSATSFSLMTDFNQNGKLETTESRHVNFNPQSGVKITGNSLTFPITMYFDRRGRVVDINGVIFTPTFIVCTDNCTTETATAENADIISISANGTVAMLHGGETQPTFQNPNVSSVCSSTKINEWLTVSENTVNSNTSTPTPTPCQTPTPTTTATPTASTSPTPIVCKKNDYPAVTNCTCQLPMTVRSNGQCK